jgi:hypothetical protein
MGYINVIQSVVKANSNKRLELKRAKLQSSIDQLSEQLEDSILFHMDDVTKQTLEKKISLIQEISRIDAYIVNLKS